MKILHISSYDVYGGAAIAAYRIHRAQVAAGMDSRMLVKKKYGNDELVVQANCQPEVATEMEYAMQDFLQESYVNANRSTLSDTLYSINLLADSLSQLPEVLAADILHLHWIAGFVGVREIGRLLGLGKPIVWTLHDQWAFTAGYHYDFGAGGYGANDFTGPCAQLQSDPLLLSETLTSYKSAIFSQPNLFIVCPSQWIAECSQRSFILGKQPSKVIPSVLDAAFYEPYNKTAARAELGWVAEDFLILFSGASGLEKRKGLADCIESVRRVIENYPEKIIRVVYIGHEQPLLSNLPFPVIAMGLIPEVSQIRKIILACDVFLHPSLEDNSPNSLLEALYCGVPSIAYAVGGVPEIIRHEVNGLLVPRGDITGLQTALERVLTKEVIFCPSNSPEWLASDYSIATSADSYLKFYTQALLQSNDAATTTISVFDPLTAWLATPLLAWMAQNISKITAQSNQLLTIQAQFAEQTKMLEIKSAQLENRKQKCSQLLEQYQKRGKKIEKLVLKCNKLQEKIQLTSNTPTFFRRLKKYFRL